MTDTPTKQEIQSKSDNVPGAMPVAQKKNNRNDRKRNRRGDSKNLERDSDWQERVVQIRRVSKTVLIEPPAITPVPGAAGLINTLAAPSRPLDKVGIELFGVKGTLTRFFLPSETPFLTAPMTSPALPTPTPT